MKKSYLFGALAIVAGSAVAQNAEPRIYLPISETETNQYTLGSVTDVSPNGLFAVICDDENFKSYLWNINEPEIMKELEGRIHVYGVNDLGMMVGERRQAGGATRPIVYRDGEWITLDVHPNTLNTATAYRITNDGSVITGITMIKDDKVETGGGYRANTWKWEDGKYVLYPHDNFPEELRGHQGFMMTDMSADGRIISGYAMVAFSQCEIPCLVVDGEYKYWDKVEKRLEPFYYNGQYMGDYEEWYVNGYHDTTTEKNFQGSFMFIDDVEGKVYGYRTRASNLDDKGEGTLTTGACIYDIETDTFIDNPDYYLYSYKINDLLFAANMGYLSFTTIALKDGEKIDLETAFGLSEVPVNVQGVSYGSADGNVVAGVHGIMNEAKQYYDYFPYIIVKDPTVGVGTVGAEAGNAAVISVRGNVISVEGAEGLVYDMQGRLAGKGTNVEVAAGIYIVKAGETVKKVIVK